MYILSCQNSSHYQIKSYHQLIVELVIKLRQFQHCLTGFHMGVSPQLKLCYASWVATSQAPPPPQQNSCMNPCLMLENKHNVSDDISSFFSLSTQVNFCWTTDISRLLVGIERTEGGN